MPEAALVVTDLVKRYGERRAVDGLTFAARAGQVTAVLGANGAGKTTTIEICAGLKRADGGRVEILGQSPGSEAARARVAMMPQAGSTTGVGVAGTTRAREALQLFASYFSRPLDPDGLIERLGLESVASTPWRRLSGGEQQRLSLALALVGRPELVFLDEPTAGLDLHARLDMFDLIGELKSAGVTVILTTHLLDEAEQLADEIVVIAAGRAVANGSPAALTQGRSLESVFLELTGRGQRT